MLSLPNSVENPSETPLSSWKVELFEQRRLRVLRDPGLVKNKNQSKMKKRDFFVFPPTFLTRAEEVIIGERNRYRLSDGVGEEGSASSDRDP